METDGVMLPVIEAHCDYKQPARYDDEIEVRTTAELVSPVRVDLSARKATAAMTVRNDSDQPVVIQLQTVAWSQAGGQDSTTPTSDLIATPPLFTLPAQSSQIVRVGLRKPDPLASRRFAFSCKRCRRQSSRAIKA